MMKLGTQLKMGQHGYTIVTSEHHLKYISKFVKAEAIVKMVSLP